ncbi:MAG: class I SAM-dependent methyltransferase [Candidatus Heimdallarchaeaceae archaeon]
MRIKIGEKVFDAGCGIGLDSLRMASRGALVTAGDISPDFKYSLLLGDVKLRKRINFITMDLRFIPIKSKAFDKIVCIDVLEHINDDKRVLAEFSRILKSRGELLVHVPNLKRYAKLKNSKRKKIMRFEKSILKHVRNGYTLNQLSSLFKKIIFKSTIMNTLLAFGHKSQEKFPLYSGATS